MEPNKMIKRLVEKIALIHNYYSIEPFMKKKGFTSVGGQYKQVFVKNGCEYVIKIQNKSLCESEEVIKREICADETFARFRPKVFLRGENELFHIFVQEKVNSGWEGDGISCQNKLYRRFCQKIYKEAVELGKFDLDIHEGNFGFKMNGQPVFFDGV